MNWTGYDGSDISSCRMLPEAMRNTVLLQVRGHCWLRHILLLFLTALLSSQLLADVTSPATTTGNPSAIPPRPDYIPQEVPPCPTWDPTKTLISPYFPCPGQQLGRPKDEAIAALRPDVRNFLDGVLRLYREPGLFADLKKTLAIFEMELEERIWITPSTNQEHLPKPFIDRLAGGILDSPGWKAKYRCCTYDIYKQPDKDKWHNTLVFVIDHHQECVNSRAVEGYLDLYLYPEVHSVPPPLPKFWYRHGKAGGAFSRSLSSKTPGIRLGFIDGCLVHIEISGNYFQNEYTNDRIYN